MYTIEEGRLAVQIARETVENRVIHNVTKSYENLPPVFTKKSGVFVTLNTYPKHELRGCIGYPEPIYPLIKALINAAISAATEDPRFPPVSADELDKIVIEVSLLTPPELIKVKNTRDYINEIKIGRDGLIVSKGFNRGLLLPQVATEYGWSAEEFLEQTCWKAGLTPDTWLDRNTKIYKFSATIFMETKPRGEIVLKDLK